jgi:hypothetical protein
MVLIPYSGVSEIVFTYCAVDLTEQGTCEKLASVIATANLAIMPAVCGLFFVRLSAIYAGNKYIMTFFGLCWLGILGIFIFDTTTVLSRFRNDSTSFQCFSVKNYDAWEYIATALYDTLIYIAISWQLASLGMNDGWKYRLKSFVTGGGLSGLARVLLRSGQTYYL